MWMAFLFCIHGLYANRGLNNKHTFPLSIFKDSMQGEVSPTSRFLFLYTWTVSRLRSHKQTCPSDFINKQVHPLSLYVDCRQNEISFSFMLNYEQNCILVQVNVLTYRKIFFLIGCVFVVFHQLSNTVTNKQIILLVI